MLPLPPDSILFSIGPLAIRWYGLLYAVGLLVAYQFMVREAKRRKLNADLIANGLIIISIAALVGGRLYHVVDAWDRYSANPIGALIPPYEGLGAPGGLITGAAALAILLRRWRQSPWGWVDVAGPAILVMLAIARWGNWFNQELYGLPPICRGGSLLIARIAPLQPAAAQSVKVPDSIHSSSTSHSLASLAHWCYQRSASV